MTDLLCQHEVRYICRSPSGQKHIGGIAIFDLYPSDAASDLIVRVAPTEGKLIEADKTPVTPLDWSTENQHIYVF